MNYPLPATMPVEAAANIMVKRGEFRSFGQACAVLRHRRQQRAKYGKTTMKPEDSGFQNVESDRQAFANLERRGLA